MQTSLPTTISGTLGDYLHQSQPQYLANTFAPGASLMAGASQPGELGREMGVGREMAVDEFLSMHADSRDRKSVV